MGSLLEIRRLHNEAKKRGERGWANVKLGISRMSEILKPVWEKHFSKEVNAKAWDKIGVYPFTRRVYWELRQEEAHHSNHEDAEMATDAAREIVFPNQQDDDDEGDGDDDDADGDGEDVPRARTKFNTGDVCFDGPVTLGDTRERIAERTGAAVDAAATKAANTAEREASARQEIADAYPVAKALDARFNDPADNYTVDNVNVHELKSLLIYHNIPFKKSGVNKKHYLDLAKAYYASL